MSKLTREEMDIYLDKFIQALQTPITTSTNKRGFPIIPEIDIPMLQAIRKLIEKPTYELADGTVCCRHCGTALGYEEDFEGSTNVPMERKLMEKPERVRVSRERARIAVSAIWGYMMYGKEGRALKELTELGIKVEGNDG